MPKLTLTDKKKLSKCYCDSLFKLYYEDNLISDKEMNDFISDVLLLNNYFSLYEWKKIPISRKSDIIFKLISCEIKESDRSEGFNLSPITILWIRMHFSHSKIYGSNTRSPINIYNLDHFPVLEYSIREVIKKVITIYIDVPDFIKTMAIEERKRIFSQIFNTYYAEDIKDPVIRSDIRTRLNNIKENKNNPEETYQYIYYKYFKKKSPKFVKIYFNYVPDNTADEDYKTIAQKVFDYKLNYFRKKIILNKI
jgi:hypothetical protein